MLAPMTAARQPSPTLAAEFAKQWNLEAIDAAGAWAAGELGSPDVLVAVLDTGIDANHPDLIGRVDKNRSTSFLDDAASVCRPGEPGTPSTTFEHDEALDRALPLYTDFHSHGTAVAGLISSNAVNLAGVTQRTRLMAVKVHDRNRTIPNCLSIYLKAIRYAADQGADVIHLSIPSEFTRSQFGAAFDGYVAEVNAATNYAHGEGAVLVAAAGNAMPGQLPQEVAAGSDVFRFCVADHVICLSATAPPDAAALEAKQWDQRAASSYFGPAIDFTAPGGTGTAGAVTNVWLVCAQQSMVTTGAPAKCRDADGIPPLKLSWGSNGTSFAAAATSSLAALLVDIVGKEPSRPRLRRDQGLGRRSRPGRLGCQLRLGTNRRRDGGRRCPGAC
jgi:subtilisin family serine protease